MTHPALPLLDLTSLSDDDTEESVRELCARARTAEGDVAAVCVLPRHVAAAKEALAGSGVRVATVVAFPDGEATPEDVAAESERAVADGADELDLVVPWRDYLDGRPDAVTDAVHACARAGRPVKAILETGEHPDSRATRAMAESALHAGAAFLKTSTGTTRRGATPQAVRILLEAVKEEETGGVKVSGGVRTREDAEQYVTMAREVMGEDWVTPDHLRIGASSLLDALLGSPR